MTSIFLLLNKRHSPPPVRVFGHCKPLPKGLELWVFGISGFGKAAKYWPQDAADVKEDRNWSVTCSLGNWKPGDLRRYGAFVVGENGQALINSYKSVARALSPKGDPKWPGLAAAEVTTDVVPCGPIKEIPLTGLTQGD